MTIYYISDCAPPRLEEHGLRHYLVKDTHSLVQAVRKSTADIFVLDQRERLDYSLPHILSAAQMAAAREKRFILLGTWEVPENSFLRQIPEAEGLPALLSRQEQTMAAKASGPARRSRLPAVRPKEKPKQKEIPKIRPLALADSRPHLVTVAGSQTRTGCTTQCLQLYFYFRALGYEPAVMTTEQRIAELSGLMDSKWTDTGVAVLEGIPFLSGVGMQPPYDLFLEDCGCLTSETLENFLDGELPVLVCGVKPWELQSAANALALLQGQKALAVTVSFCTEEAGRKALGPLLERMEIQGPILAAPWQPDAFRAGNLLPYDSALRRTLEQLFRSPLAPRKRKEA